MSRRPKQFTPYRSQIDCAKRRILGYLEREAGAVTMGSSKDIRTLHKHITQPRDLGSNYERQCTTLGKALEELQKEKLVVWDGNEHMLGVTYAFTRSKRMNSSQRYTHRRAMRRAIA